jgi:flavin-dependent dehydrogenase
MRATVYDVAIAGGGPAGAAAAIVLARAGLRVLLADAGGAHRFKIGEGLPPSARHLLHELGALDRILADGHRASHGTFAFWGGDTPHANDFMFQLHGHGLQLDRKHFDGAMLEHAQASGAEAVRDAKLSLLSPASNAVSHRLQLGTASAEAIIECRWLIDATGRPATLARQLGATRARNDALLAFHMRLAAQQNSTRADNDQDGRTWVEAVENGWWYSVLLPSCERLVAFLGDADLVDRRTLLTRDGLWQALQDAPHLSELCREHGYAPAPDSAPHGADACSSRLDRAADMDVDGKGWLAVGDAALAFDPLSSKGISNALYTGLRAAHSVLDALRGDREALPRYDTHLREIFRVYCEQLAGFHAIETRWPHATFWKRRQGHGSGNAVIPEAVKVPCPGVIRSLA